tara:strand:- start:248461 stop:248712 length:252 start_codon:yes stop_codon:yes gene_type:complete
MIAVPDPRYGLIVFDGSVLEVFASNGESRRYHVQLIKSVELVEKKNYFEIKYSDTNLSQRFPFKPEAMDNARELVEAIKGVLT